MFIKNGDIHWGKSMTAQFSSQSYYKLPRAVRDAEFHFGLLICPSINIVVNVLIVPSRRSQVKCDDFGTQTSSSGGVALVSRRLPAGRHVKS